jgi:hypothetical protein
MGAKASYWPRPAAVWSVRRVNKNYSGYCMRVRRSSDSSEQDIGFDADQLDTTALSAFVGVDATCDGYVVTWYDQWKAYNASNPVASEQPQIVAAGVIKREPSNSKPSLYFNSVAMNLVCNAGSSVLGGCLSNFAITASYSHNTKINTPAAEKSIYGESKIFGGSEYIMEFTYVYGGPTMNPSPRISLYDSYGYANAAFSAGGASFQLNKTYVVAGLVKDSGNYAIHYVQNNNWGAGPTIPATRVNPGVNGFRTDACWIGSNAKMSFIAPFGTGLISEVKLYKTFPTAFQLDKINTSQMTYFNTSGLP